MWSPTTTRLPWARAFPPVKREILRKLGAPPALLDATDLLASQSDKDLAGFKREFEVLNDLHERGALSDAEFEHEVMELKKRMGIGAAS